jgi:hypothetical protein
MGKIKKILENELVGGTQTTDVYPVTSVKAVYDENNERLDHILNRRGVVNISTNYNDDHIAEVLTLSQAIAKVPSSDRVLGFQGNILTPDGWITYKFIGTDITQWSNTEYWAAIIDSSILEQEIGNKRDRALSQKAVNELLPIAYSELSLEKGAFKVTEKTWLNDVDDNTVRLRTPLFKTSRANFIVPSDYRLGIAYGNYNKELQKWTDFHTGVVKLDISYPYARILVRKTSGDEIEPSEVRIPILIDEIIELQDSQSKDEYYIGRNGNTLELANGRFNTDTNWTIDIESSIRLRSKIFRTDKIRVKCPDGYHILACYGDANFTFATATFFSVRDIDIDVSYPYFRILVRRIDNGNLTIDELPLLDILNTSISERVDSISERVDSTKLHLGGLDADRSLILDKAILEAFINTSTPIEKLKVLNITKKVGSRCGLILGTGHDADTYSFMFDFRETTNAEVLPSGVQLLHTKYRDIDGYVVINWDNFKDETTYRDSDPEDTFALKNSIYSIDNSPTIKSSLLNSKTAAIANNNTTDITKIIDKLPAELKDVTYYPELQVGQWNPAYFTPMKSNNRFATPTRIKVLPNEITKVSVTDGYYMSLWKSETIDEEITNIPVSWLQEWEGAVGANYLVIICRKGDGTEVLTQNEIADVVVTLELKEKDKTKIEDVAPLSEFDSISERVDNLDGKMSVDYSGYNNYNVITLKADGSGDFTSIYEAINFAREKATASNRYEIQLYDDIRVTDTDGFFTYSSLGAKCVFYLPAYIKLRGMGEKKIIYAELPNSGYSQTDRANHQTGYVDGNSEMENIHVIAKNIRYAVHVERGGGVQLQNSTIFAKDCIFEHLGGEEVDTVQNKWYQPDAMGCGASSGLHFEFVGCDFISTTGPFRCHTNHDFTNPVSAKFTSCRFIMTMDSIQQYRGGSESVYESKCIYLDDLGSKVTRLYEFYGCEFTGKITDSSAPYFNTSISKIFPSGKYVGYGNSKFFFDHSVSPRALKITSNTIGNTSSVEVISDEANLLGNTTIIKGSTGLNGYVYGDEYINHATLNNLMVKLGDCSTTNKTLVLKVDGSEKTITFNLDFTGYTVSNVVQFMNTKLQGAEVSLFNPYANYFAEFSDVAFNRKNTSEAPIKKGMFVKFDGINGIIPVSENETKGTFAMATDDIPVGKFGTVVKNTILKSTGNFAHGVSSLTKGQLVRFNSNSKLEKCSGENEQYAVYMCVEDTYIEI